MKILAIPATNHKNSINRLLLTYAATILDAQSGGAVEVDFVDLNDYEFAIYSPEREAEGIPAGARELFDRIGSADAIMVSFAEYNGSYTPAWKNTFDWMSRIDTGVYQGRRVVLLAATPGPRAGAGVLGAATMATPHFGADVIGHLGIGSFAENFDLANGRISNDELDTQLRDILIVLAG
ncbi:MAG: NAD(P)H-dependent oxidoreductase [Actinomycetota bacterium]